MNFEIIIDDFYSQVNPQTTLSPIANKSVLSLINGFEDDEWRFTNFQNFIWDNITETSLSFKERESLINSNHSTLTLAAQKLRLTDKIDDISKGSEIAEIILYGIMKHHYSALPVVPKIFYKQNPQDNAKGADSVHIVLEGDDDFSIWFGEAKFYNSIEDARLGEIIKSIEASLDTKKIKKENSIITNVSDIDFLIPDANRRDNIKKALSYHESIDSIKPKLHIPILLLHECAITTRQLRLTDAYKQEIIDFHKQRAESYFKKQIDKIGTLPMYSEIKFHIILFPVPSKKEVIDKFISIADFYKNLV